MEIEGLEDCIDFIKDYKIGDKVLIVSLLARYKPHVVEIVDVKRKYIRVGKSDWEARYFDKDGFSEKPERGYSPRAYITGKVEYAQRQWLIKHHQKILNSIAGDYETIKKIAEIVGYKDID